MAQAKILLDSNAYFRLAKELHPLLFQEFGSESFCLYVLKDLEAEYDRSLRLKTKFSWVHDPEYKANRCKPLSLSRRQKADITIAEGLIWETVQSEMPGPSRIDVRNLAHGYVLGIPVVTDDLDMTTLATVFEISTMSTLRLLKLMLDCHHIKLRDVRRIVRFWRWLGDLPTGFTSDYRKLFKAAPPA